MYGYVYLTTNLVNGKKYIGRKVSKCFAKWYYGSGTALIRALKKYGKTNFSVKILEELPDGSTSEQLSEREIYWIDKFNAVESPDFYNLHPGGSSWYLPEHRSEKHKESIKKTHWSKSENADEIKKRISEARKGIVFSENHRKHLSESKRNPSDETRKKLHDAHVGKSLSTEHVKKIAESLTGKTRSDEVRRRISESSKGKRRITNGYQNTVIRSDEPLPLGWWYGVTYNKNKSK